MTNKQIKELNKKTNNLLREVDANEVISFAGNVPYIGGKEATNIQIKNLVAEAMFLKNSEIWRVFQETLTEMARKKMFENSSSFDDMLGGKWMLYNLDIQKTIVDNLAALSDAPIKNPINVV